jgi:hypothetical protein
MQCVCLKCSLIAAKTRGQITRYRGPIVIGETFFRALIYRFWRFSSTFVQIETPNAQKESAVVTFCPTIISKLRARMALPISSNRGKAYQRAILFRSPRRRPTAATATTSANRLLRSFVRPGIQHTESLNWSCSNKTLRRQSQ